jgi:TetR/AcrR family transcriptional regulator
MGKEEQTKERILQAARKIFHQKGLSGARMSEIAEEAEINKAMLHYYFKTKQSLFDEVFFEAFSQIFPQLIQIIGTDRTIEEKIREISAFYNQMLRENPQLPVFVLSSVQENAERFAEKVLERSPIKPAEMMGKFMMQIAESHQKGEIRAIDPRHLVINMIAMSVFPFMMKPILVHMLGIPEKDFDAFAKERENGVADFILNSIKIDKDS